MKTILIFFGAVLMAFLAYLIFNHFNINLFIIGWASCSAYISVIFCFKKHL